MELNSDTVFRDAHLKNRVLKTNEPEVSKILKDLEEINEGNISEFVNNNTFEIDFETAKNKVTKWDDICHILLFDSSGLLNIDLSKSDNEIIQEGNKIVNILSEIFSLDIKSDDINLFWQTLLFRATREHCRRIWYANLMPNTYNSRYYYERTSYYIELAIYARIQSNSFPYLQKFLEYLQTQNKYLFRFINFNDIDNKLSPYVPALKIIKCGNKEKQLNAINDKAEKISHIIKEHNATESENEIKTELNNIFIWQPNIWGFGVDLIKLFRLTKKISEKFTKR